MQNVLLYWKYLPQQSDCYRVLAGSYCGSTAQLYKPALPRYQCISDIYILFASSTNFINSPRSKAGTNPGLPEYNPPMLLPPTNTFGRDDCPVISSSAALFAGALIRPGIHSLPSEISLKLFIPTLFSNATASLQNGESSYVSEWSSSHQSSDMTYQKKRECKKQ